MIVFHENYEIDKVRWDNCIKDSPRSLPYAYSWYLDHMSPGWQALIEGDYNSVFPIPGSVRFGIKYIATPIFLQQLGVCCSDKTNPIDISRFLDKIPDDFKLVDLCVGQKVIHNEFIVTEKADFELDLSKPYELLYKNFNRNCKRNILQSSKFRPVITDDIAPIDLIKLFIENKGSEINGIKKSAYSRLENLMNYCISNKKGKISGVLNENKKLFYGLFFLISEGRKTMILLANTPESHEKRTGYYVYNELIRESAGSDIVLDFSGSSIPSIASFMKSFGSVNNPYYRIYRNRLPWPVRFLKE